MGPLQYVIAHREAGARPISGEVYDGSPTYCLTIFVRKDSGSKRSADLRGKTIAFVDPLSSSGYLYPLDIFKRAGLIESRGDASDFFRKIYFAGGDEQAIRAVLNGSSTPPASVSTPSASCARRSGTRCLDRRLAPIPSHGVVVRKGLDAGLADASRERCWRSTRGRSRSAEASLQRRRLCRRHENLSRGRELAVSTVPQARDGPNPCPVVRARLGPRSLRTDLALDIERSRSGRVSGCSCSGTAVRARPPSPG